MSDVNLGQIVNSVVHGDVEIAALRLWSHTIGS